MMPGPKGSAKDGAASKTIVPKTVSLVGLMGAGKSCIGKRLEIGRAHV